MPSIIVDNIKIEIIIIIYKGGSSACFLRNIINKIIVLIKKPIYMPSHLEQTHI